MPLRIGIDLGGTKIEGVALDGSREAARLRVDTPRDDYEGTLDGNRDVLSTVSKPRGRRIPIPNPESRHVPTVGIGIPGTIVLVHRPRQECQLHVAHRPGRFSGISRQRLGRPIRLANDANCFAISEAADGAGAGAEVVFGVIAGTGVGGGIVVNGRIISGANGIAGEWGHNPLPWAEVEAQGPLCYCGKRGCIETFLSGPGLTADHERVTGVRLLPPRDRRGRRRRRSQRRNRRCVVTSVVSPAGWRASSMCWIQT